MLEATGVFLLMCLGMALLLAVRLSAADSKTDDAAWGPLRAESLRRFARRRGLISSESGRSAGAIHGVTVALFIDERPRGGGLLDCAVLRCALGEAVAPGLVLTEQTFEGRLAPLLSDGDAQPSAAQLDAAFALPGATEAVRSVLADREVRLALLRALGSSQWLCISKGVLEVSSNSGFDTPGLAALLDPGLALVKAMRAAHARSALAEGALETERPPVASAVAQR